ncbi:hypothetical protein FRB94_012690 [Tulasnella sp. JGI-2019a]|nr:hypothetical protein FRB94_012690 [Tulasnella sp. JGI-2019a]
MGHDHRRLPAGVKFFLTSRPEPHIRGELERAPVLSTVELLSLDVEGSPTVQMDITLYLKGLPSMVRKFGIMDENWPGESKCAKLAQMAGESFIWAATVVLLVADPSHRDPEAQLEHILSTPSLKNLDYLYSSTLEHAFPPSISESVLSLLRDTFGALVFAQTPLTADMVASLLSPATNSPEVTLKSIRNCVLRFLGSVLTVTDHGEMSSNKPIQFLHKSTRRWQLDAFG